jgi:hypothetical protein
MIGRGFISSPLPILVINGSMMSRTRIRGMSWQNAFADKFRGLPTQLLFSSTQQMRSHSTKQPQGKAAKKNKNDENGTEHSAISGKDELHTHTHSILGHSHTHGGDEHEHGHDPEQILAALKGSGVLLDNDCSNLNSSWSFSR